MRVQVARAPDRSPEPRPTLRRYVCRFCGGGGTMVSMSPAPGYACGGCVGRHGKEALVGEAMRRDMLGARRA